jgi:hypothetical protein
MIATKAQLRKEIKELRDVAGQMPGLQSQTYIKSDAFSCWILHRHRM